MVALDTLKPHLTRDFVVAFKTLGKQVGYRNLGRAIAYMKMPDNGATPEQASEPSITPRGSVAPAELPKKGPLWVRAFTPCAEHAKEAQAYILGQDGRGPDFLAYSLRDMLARCDACKEWSNRHARIMAEEMVNRNAPMPHSKNKWWYQETCPHNGWGKSGDCEQCGRNQLTAWIKASK